MWDALPRVLCLVCNRTSWATGRPKKVTTHVAFPLEGLDLAPFCTAPPGAAGAATTGRRRRSSRYALFAALLHHGRGMTQGHYTACARGGRDGDQWLHFNDDQVKPVTPETVAKKQAYILFYLLRGDGD